MHGRRCQYVDPWDTSPASIYFHQYMSYECSKSSERWSIIASGGVALICILFIIRWAHSKTWDGFESW
jgi:hypothetical protein